MKNIDVADALWEILQADWPATTLKDRISKQNIKELIRKFILKVIDILHDGRSDLVFRQAIDDLTIEKVITDGIGDDMRQANNTGYNPVEEYMSTKMKEAHDHLK